VLESGNRIYLRRKENVFGLMYYAKVQFAFKEKRKVKKEPAPLTWASSFVGVTIFKF